MAYKATAKLPPAESPAIIIFFGCILKYLFIFSTRNSYTLRQSYKGIGNLLFGGFL